MRLPINRHITSLSFSPFPRDEFPQPIRSLSSLAYVYRLQIGAYFVTLYRTYKLVVTVHVYQEKLRTNSFINEYFSTIQPKKVKFYIISAIFIHRRSLSTVLPIRSLVSYLFHQFLTLPNRYTEYLNGLIFVANEIIHLPSATPRKPITPYFLRTPIFRHCSTRKLASCKSTHIYIYIYIQVQDTVAQHRIQIYVGQAGQGETFI